jgi:light-regulated signal transduction histidine kinase (bacteriophytochrome)
VNRIRNGERVNHYQTKRRTKDGRVLTVSLTVSPIRDGSGKIIGASKVARDITEREQSELALRAANEALRRANADLEQFAYAAAHDLREPLRMVITYSQMLERKFGSTLGAQGQQYLQYSIQGASRMEILVRDLLAYVQAAAVNAALPVPQVDSTAPLKHAMLSLQTAIDESGAQISCTELPVVRMHEVHLQQIFQNLLSNAMKYRSTMPLHIAIAAERLDGEHLFYVRDNGLGIDPVYKERIFGLFKRLHTADEYAGSGIGLAICQRIVEHYGGRIWVESQLGQGATFFFTVPDREKD